jgi:hypothetical protein
MTRKDEIRLLMLLAIYYAVCFGIGLSLGYYR